LSLSKTELLTESEAWRTIGEAFEARAAHPELEDEVSLDDDLAFDGVCAAIDHLDMKLETHTFDAMHEQIDSAVEDPANTGALYLQPFTSEPGGSELRATLAYLFAEAAQ
jgi:hypothetical protein